MNQIKLHLFRLFQKLEKKLDKLSRIVETMVLKTKVYISFIPVQGHGVAGAYKLLQTNVGLHPGQCAGLSQGRTTVHTHWLLRGQFLYQVKAKCDSDVRGVQFQCQVSVQAWQDVLQCDISIKCDAILWRHCV